VTRGKGRRPSPSRTVAVKRGTAVEQLRCVPYILKLDAGEELRTVRSFNNNPMRPLTHPFSRLVTSLIRRNVTFGRVSVVIQAGTAEFKLADRSECTATSLKGSRILTDPEQNSRALPNDRASELRR